MRNILNLLYLLSVFVVAGCASYDGLVYFNGSGETLNIKMDKFLRSGMSYIEAYNAQSGLLCTGSARTSHGSKSMWSCKGEDGHFMLACNDGRHLRGLWSAENCSAGQGLGVDQYGNTFILSYGTDSDDILRKSGLDDIEWRQASGAGAPAGPLYTSMLGSDGVETALIYMQAQPAPANGQDKLAMADADSKNLSEHAQALAPAYADRVDPMQVETDGQGLAGFFISNDGRIVTSAKPLLEADLLHVYLPAGNLLLPATIVSVNLAANSAILKVDAQGDCGDAVQVFPYKQER